MSGLQVWLGRIYLLVYVVYGIVYVGSVENVISPDEWCCGCSAEYVVSFFEWCGTIENVISTDRWCGVLVVLKISVPVGCMVVTM